MIRNTFRQTRVSPCERKCLDADRTERGKVRCSGALTTEDKTSNLLSPLGLRIGVEFVQLLIEGHLKPHINRAFSRYPTLSFLLSFLSSLRSPLNQAPHSPFPPRDASPLGFHFGSHARHYWYLRRSLLHSLCIISALLFSTLRYPRSLVCGTIRLLAHDTRSPPPTMQNYQLAIRKIRPRCARRSEQGSLQRSHHYEERLLHSQV